MEYEKQFLIIGNVNAITYKEIFPLIKDNRLWLGHENGTKIYQVPEDYYQDRVKRDSTNNSVFVGEDGKKYCISGNTYWYTNLYVDRSINPLTLSMTYEKGLAKGLYPKYDNYDAIEVGEVAHIPVDYYGAMGVPASFLTRWVPPQLTKRERERERERERGFKILGNLGSYGVDGYSLRSAIYINGKKQFKRILIQRVQNPWNHAKHKN